MPRRRSRETLSLAVVLLLTVWNIVRARTAIAWSPILTEFSVRPGPFYLASTGLVWSLLGVWVAAGLIARARWAGRLLLLSSLAYTAWYWLDRLLLHEPRPGLPFTLALNLAALALLASTGAAMMRDNDG